MNLPFTQFESAEDAEVAFYESLRNADLDAMMEVWSEESDIICIHPHGPRLIGPEQVRASWQAVFENGAVHIRAVQQHCTNTSRLAIHNLIEEVTVNSQEGPQILLCYATNIYIRDLRGWRLSCHHASGAGDEELAEPEHHGLLH